MQLQRLAGDDVLHMMCMIVIGKMAMKMILVVKLIITKMMR